MQFFLVLSLHPGKTQWFPPGLNVGIVNLNTEKAGFHLVSKVDQGAVRDRPELWGPIFFISDFKWKTLHCIVCDVLKYFNVWFVSQKSGADALRVENATYSSDAASSELS